MGLRVVIGYEVSVQIYFVTLQLTITYYVQRNTVYLLINTITVISVELLISAPERFTCLAGMLLCFHIVNSILTIRNAIIINDEIVVINL